MKQMITVREVHPSEWVFQMEQGSPGNIDGYCGTEHYKVKNWFCWPCASWQDEITVSAAYTWTEMCDANTAVFWCHQFPEQRWTSVQLCPHPVTLALRNLWNVLMYCADWLKAVTLLSLDNCYQHLYWTQIAQLMCAC